MIGPSKRTNIKAKRTNYARVAIWATVALVLLAGITLFLHKDAKPERIVVRHEKKHSKPAIVKSSTQKPVSTEKHEAEVVDPKKLPHPLYDKKIHPSLPPKKYVPTIEEVENARLGPDGKPRKMSIYKTPAEQALGMIFTTELGSPPPILPSIPRCTSKEQLHEFLERTFEYDKDASKAVNENRIMMNQVKDELKKYLDEGGSIGGFIDFYVGELRASHEQWKTAQKMLVDMARSGEDAESLRSFRDAANKLLAEKGIKAITVPPSVRKAMGEK